MNSVHLQKFPEVDYLCNINIIESMDAVRKICNTVLFLRKENNIKVKMPLAELIVHGKNFKLDESYFNIILDEVNVKNIVIVQDIEQIAKPILKINLQIIVRTIYFVA